ncbi:hypothetical protein ACUXST_000514 [Sphingomonas sp. F9_3S_D5_B_2]
MPKRSKAPHRADARGGGFMLIPHALADSDAFRTLPFRSRAVLLALLRRFDGYNNGRIGLSTRKLADALGTTNYSANSEALGYLVARGIVAVERVGERGSRRSREFRLTFISTGEGPGEHASNDYLSWRAGDAGTGKNRHAKFTARGARSAALNTADRKVSASDVTTNETSSGGIASREISGTVVSFPAHIRNHTGSSATRGRGAHSAPDALDLRAASLALIERVGRGSQTRLAHDAGIPAGTLSKFLKRNGPLAAPARVQLTIALARLEHWKEYVR